MRRIDLTLVGRDKPSQDEDARLLKETQGHCREEASGGDFPDRFGRRLHGSDVQAYFLHERFIGDST